jgi:hypothetical protein
MYSSRWLCYFWLKSFSLNQKRKIPIVILTVIVDDVNGVLRNFSDKCR